MNDDLLVRCARFTKDLRTRLDRLVGSELAGLVTLDTVILESHLAQVVDDRLTFSEELLRVGRDLASRAAGDPALLRLALNRAYYAMHHALRALHLELKGWDPDDHQKTLRAFADLLIDDEKVTPRRLSGLDGLDTEAQACISERHVADYHMYNRQSSDEPPIDFSVQAPLRLAQATQMVAQVRLVVEWRRTPTP